jgi:tRNA pseudouridine55 synthase
MTSAVTNSSGILLLDKPAGVSSFAALYPVKRAFGGKKGAKIGHAGTLDPAASGLLVIGVGAGTRLLEFLEAMPKSYRFMLNLGVTTDSYDLEGEVLERKDASRITRADIDARLGEFLGSISQMPPAYSAIKIQGKRACDRVRDGEAVTLSARNVRIDRIEVISFDPATATAVVEMDCSKGTYVRSLAHDLGRALGCGAAADQIRRLAIGSFRVEDAVAPSGIGTASLLPLESAVRHLPALCVKESWIARLLNGNAIPTDGYSLKAGTPVPDGRDPDATYAVFSESGALLAMATVNPSGQLCPHKVFSGTAAPTAAT